MKKNRIQRFEHGTLKIGDDGFNENHFAQLNKLNERNNYKYFAVGHRRIKFTQFVGVIQVGNLTIEILPKADDGESDYSKWQAVFITMLRESGLLPVHALTEANLSLKNISIIDLFFQQFVSEVEKLVHQGLIKKYHPVQNNTNSLKGKLLFSEQYKHNMIHKERFYNQYQTFDKNNIYNQILVKALRLLPSLINSSISLSNVNNLLLDLEEIDDIIVVEDTFKRIKYDRKTDVYRKAILIAKMILLNYSPDIKYGVNNILSLLFDMNDVFEHYIYRKLKRSEDDFKYYSLTVKSQRSKKFWNSKTIRPDIIVEYENSEGIPQKIIIDTKWKVLKAPIPSDADLKQMYAYNLHFGAKQSYLMYPNVHNLDCKDGSFHDSVSIMPEYQNHQCQLFFVDMFEGGKLRGDLGKRVLKEILSTN